MLPDWTEVVMEDRDHYTGYGYASIIIRANMVAQIALNNIRTKSNKESFVHPYLDVISKSPTFSDYKFWSDISTYLDLEGIYYLMAVRNFENGKYGNIMEFKLLSPYNITRVWDKDFLNVAGYTEVKNGMIREIPKEMIIEIGELNPFTEKIPYAMTDAAKESQFTLNTLGDYTRHALRNNINAPGILATDVALEAQEFENFKKRIKEHTKGEPIFGNGNGAVKWENMQIELSKSASKDINEINRDKLFAVSGVSKTIMGIEQSGTTRETSRTQKELMIENHILPRIQMIIDALNQDYKNNRLADFKMNQADIVVDNPLGVDLDSRKTEIEVKDSELNLYQKLINKGVDKEIASDFVKGNIDIDALDLEKEEPVIPPANDTSKDNPPDDSKETIKKKVNKPHLSIEEKIKNAIEDQGLISQSQASLKNTIINIDTQLLMAAYNRIPKKIKNAVGEDLSLEDFITKTDKKESMRDLVLGLTVFYGIVVNLQGQETTRDRSGEYALPGLFKMDKDVKDWIKDTAEKAALSHIDTVSDDIFKVARDAAMKGLSVPEIESKLKEEFSSVVTDTRATTIARTETNRAFTRAQFEADKQFADDNDLKAYKQWVTRSGNPCDACQALADEPPIPLEDNFIDKGDKVKAGGQEYDVNFEDLEAGNLHPNCSCEYELVLK